MKISLLFLALVAGSIAANIDDYSVRKAAKKLDELDQELEDFLIEDDEDEDEFDEDDEDEDQSSLVNSLTFLQGRAGVCAGAAKGSCKKQGGECVTAPFADNCKAIHGDAGKLKKQACKSKDCQCCVPPPTCDGKIKKSCSKEGGVCVLKPFKGNCRGGTLNKKACKGKHCQCCIIATTGGTGGNKDTTAKPETTVENKQQTTGRPTTTQPPVQTTTLPPQTTTPPPPPTTLAVDPTTAPHAPTTLPPAPTTLPPAPTTLPPAPTTLPPAPTTLPPAPTTLPPAPTTLPPAPTTLPPAPTTLPPVPTTLPNDPPTTPPKTTTPPPPPTTTPPPPPTTTPPPPPTTTPPPPPTTTPPKPTTTPPPPPTTTPAPPPTTTPPPPTTTPPPPPTTTRAVPKDNLLPSVVIRDETLSWTQGWFSKKEVTYTLVLSRGFGSEEEFIYIQKDKFSKGYTLDTLINICDLQYGTYELSNGRKGVFMVYHDTSLKPYQKRFKLNTDGITQDILNAVGVNIDSEDFPGTSTSSSFWDFSWLTGSYLKDVDC